MERLRKWRVAHDPGPGTFHLTAALMCAISDNDKKPRKPQKRSTKKWNQKGDARKPRKRVLF
eukprot:6349084-Amphidinium_carterae.1